MRGRYSVLMLAAALAGCGGPRGSVASAGAWPAGTQPTYGFGSMETGEAPALRTRIASCLGAKGFVTSPRPAYLVQLAASDHPARTRVIDPSAPPVKQKGATGHNVSLAVSISEVASGREVWRVTVTEPVNKAGPAPQLLADRACSAMAAPVTAG